MPQSKMQHAEYMRNWRAKKREQKDEIDRQIAKEAERLKKLTATSRINKTNINEDNWGNEPYLGKTPKPQFQNEGYEHYNFWGEKEGEENPLNKISHQQNMKALFGEHAE